MSKEIKTLHDITPDEANANKGTERGRAMLEASMRRYGAGRSILVDKNGKDIAGNKSWEVWASIAESPDDVIVVPSDGRKLVVVQRTDLDMDADPAARELAIMDNRTAEVGLSWDAFNLASLGENIDLSIAFSQEELAAIVTEDIVNLDFDDSSSNGFASDPDLGDGFQFVISLSTEQANSEEIKQGIKSFCEMHGLSYRMKVA